MFKLKILPNIVKDGKEWALLTTNTTSLSALMNTINPDWVGVWGKVFADCEDAPSYINNHNLGALVAIEIKDLKNQEIPQVLLDTKHNGKDYCLVGLPRLPYRTPEGWLGWNLADNQSELKKQIKSFTSTHKGWKYFLVPKEDCLKAPSLNENSTKERSSTKERLDMKKENKKYVGSKIKTVSPVFDWAKGKTIKAVLSHKNDEGKVKVFALVDDEDGIKGHYTKDNFPSEKGDLFPKNLKYEKLTLLEIPVEHIQELEEKKGNKIMDIDTEKLKNSGQKMANSFQHGVKVGAATEGVEFAYAQITSALVHQFGVSQETLDNPMNRELIQLAGIALLHLGSNVFDEAIPGMEHVQQGCELALEGKGKDNAQALIRTFAPLLMQAADKMDPEKAMQRIATQVSQVSHTKVPAPQEQATEEVEAEEELVALTDAAKAHAG